MLVVLSLDSNGEFLIGKLHTGDGIGTLGCEEEIPILIVVYLNIAQTSIRSTNKRKVPIYQVGEINALAFFDRYLCWCEKVAVLRIDVRGTEAHRRHGGYITRRSCCQGYRDSGFGFWMLLTGERKGARVVEGEISGSFWTANRTHHPCGR